MLSERTDTRLSALMMAGGLAGMVGSGPRFEEVGDPGGGGGAAPAGGDPSPQPSPDQSGSAGEGAGGGGAADPGAAPSGTFSRPEGGYGNFFDQLPDEVLSGLDPAYLESAHLKDTPDTPTLLKRFVDAQTALSRKGIVPPAKDAPAADWEKYHRALGKPEKPDAYALSADAIKAALPDELKTAIGEDFNADSVLGEGGLDELRSILHSANLTTAQGQAIMATYTAKMLESRAGIDKQIAAADQAGRQQMKDLWGDKVDAKLATITEFFQSQEGGDAVLKELAATGMGANVGLLKVIDDLISRPGVLPEGSLPMAGPGGHRKSRVDLEAEYRQMQSDPDIVGALTNRNHPKHREYAQRLDQITDALGAMDDAEAARAGAR